MKEKSDKYQNFALYNIAQDTVGHHKISRRRFDVDLVDFKYAERV